MGLTARLGERRQAGRSGHLVEAYERQAHPLDLPTPIAAIQFRLEQLGLNNQALVGIIGSRTRL